MHDNTSLKNSKHLNSIENSPNFWNNFTLKDYEKEYEKSLSDNSGFWKEKAEVLLNWSKKFTKIYNNKYGNDKWFEDGELNACYNCIDRWVETNPDKTAFIFDDNNGGTLKYTYREAKIKILEICHQIKHIKKGDCITVYLSMSPNAVFTALACARLGIVHNFVFGGFSSESLKMRIKDSNSKMLISQEYVIRGTKKIDFLNVIENATKYMNMDVLIFDEQNEYNNLGVVDSYINLETLSLPEKCYWDRNPNWIRWSSLNHSHKEIDCVNVNAEHPLFYLYTSGSTGKPKGLIHTTAGYLVYVAYSLKTAFDIQKNDVFCCTADIGWITGHSYSLYAPLLLGITSVILEGLPIYPSPYRYFDIISKYKITHIYTAPTVIRILKTYFEAPGNSLDLSLHDISSLRFLGSVGEPLNKQAYYWFSKNFGNTPIIDTYFQTETGGILIAPISGLIKNKPECAAYPIPGIVPFITNDLINNNKCNPNELGKIYISKSWPGIARGIINNKDRFQNAYFTTGIYFTGDEGRIGEDGLLYINGRADDVINISGHRISTAEVESAALSNSLVSEAAIISVEHEIKGQSMILFVVLKENDENYAESIRETISKSIGSFCKPERIIACPGIPKTATGKLMRRVLRSIVSNEEIRDIHTCINPEVISCIKLKSNEGLT